MPLLWFRVASAGTEPERYTLQVPFQFSSSHTLRNDSEGRTLVFGDLVIEIAENQGIQLLRVSGFRTSADAEAFLPRLQGALLRLTVVKRLSLRANLDLQAPKLHDPPIDVRNNPNFGNIMEQRGWTHVDGWVDPTPTVVIPEHLRLVELGAGSMKVTLGMPVSMFLTTLQEGLVLLSPENIAANERLALAVDLYAASLSDVASTARVISLSTTLEALLQPETVKPAVVAHIDALLKELEQRRGQQDESVEDREELNRFRSRLSSLKDESISRRLRALVVSHHQVLGETADEAHRNMKAAYDIRSKLLHEGHADTADIGLAVNWLQAAVPKILEALISQACQAPVN